MIEATIAEGLALILAGIAGIGVAVIGFAAIAHLADRRRERAYIKSRHPGLDDTDADRIRAEQKRRARRRRERGTR